MCGIAGLLRVPGTASSPPDEETVRAMTDAIRHRGPDDAGAWLDADSGIGLGHRRLSIIDLSPLGHQPMVSASGRYVVVYNGEIYNFPALWAELEQAGAQFRGASDTEVLLAAVEAWGVADAVGRCNGMFAFALWDRHDRRLWLGRDRLGQKPLYYGRVGDAFAFGSELKAIATLPGFAPEIDRGALTLFLRHGYVPEPFCIWQGLRKLPPGTLLAVDSKTLAAGRLPEPYWRLRDVARRGAEHPMPDDEAAVDGLEALLGEAVSRCMVSDVPLGAFLSGGIDSSTVVALMQANSSRKVRTFSIGFHEQAYDEAQHAAAVARHLGTDHRELYVTEQDARDVIPSLPTLYDEPFADSSQIPTHLVSRMAREHVTVALSGDGGDELFGGYNRYVWGRTVARAIDDVPGCVRRATSAAARAVPVGAWDVVGRALPAHLRQPLFGDKLHKLADILPAESPQQAYWLLTSQCRRPEEMVVDGGEPATDLGTPERWPALPSFVEQMMALDGETYLPGDILAKVDRASMGVSLEVRVPFLDHEVVEYAWRMPMSAKLQGTVGKRALRQVLYRHVPRELIERPKAGFGVPIDRWLRGELREWAEDLLDENRLRREGWLRPEPVRHMWREHLSGRRNWQHPLWCVLMFQAWYAEWRGKT